MLKIIFKFLCCQSALVAVKNRNTAVNTENINWSLRGSNLQPIETTHTAHWHWHYWVCDRAFSPAPPNTEGKLILNMQLNRFILQVSLVSGYYSLLLHCTLIYRIFMMCSGSLREATELVMHFQWKVTFFNVLLIFLLKCFSLCKKAYLSVPINISTAWIITSRNKLFLS